MVKRALITGITGQDGSYLAELLLSKGYEVHGLIRRASTFNTSRIDHLYTDPHIAGAKLFLHYAELTDGTRLATLLQEVQPDEVYHLGAQSHVRVSFDEPDFTGDSTGVATTRLLEAIRLVGLHCRFYQASSSEMFGATPPPQDEDTPFWPRSPYGAAKVYAYWMTRNYREAYGMFAVNGILFNHESPRRGETFVTRKITRSAARIKAGLDKDLYLGNLDAVRDWGYAKEYVEAMWLMLQADEPSDYVIATGSAYTVRDFLTFAFEAVDLDWHDYVKLDDRYLRPSEVDALIGDASKAERVLGWKAQTLPPDLARIMVEADLELAQAEVRSVADGTVPLDRSSRVYVAGHRGLAGSAIWRALERAGFTDLVGASSRELDLRERAAAAEYLQRVRPQVVVLAAAKVGGIVANDTYPADFLSENLRIQVNVMDAAADLGVVRLLFLGSSCIYPKFAEQPIREDSLLTGKLEPTNDAYAIAKIAGIQQVQSVRKQHGLHWISAMPTNLYGPGDNFHPSDSHVLPALIRRFSEAAESGAEQVVLWGNGTPRREFLHVDDLGEAIVHLLDVYDDPQTINVGVGEDITIRELAVIVADVVGYRGEIVQDTSKPDGTPRKLLDVSRLHALGWRARIGLREGIEETYRWFIEHHAEARLGA